ncbi:hypothetical protein FQZ97_899100 [compost metagenome]
MAVLTRATPTTRPINPNDRRRALKPQGAARGLPVEEDRDVSTEHHSVPRPPWVQKNIHAGQSEPGVVLPTGGLRVGYADHAQSGGLGETGRSARFLRAVVSRCTTQGPGLRRRRPGLRPLGLPGLHGRPYHEDRLGYRFNRPSLAPSLAYSQGGSERRPVERRSVATGGGIRRPSGGVSRIQRRSRKTGRGLSRKL